MNTTTITTGKTKSEATSKAVRTRAEALALVKDFSAILWREVAWSDPTTNPTAMITVRDIKGAHFGFDYVALAVAMAKASPGSRLVALDGQSLFLVTRKHVHEIDHGTVRHRRRADDYVSQLVRAALQDVT
jgi:hypothetical protein